MIRRFVAWVQGFALALGAPGLFLVSFLDPSFISLPEVTDLLLDTLKSSAPASIFNVTAPSTVLPDFDDLQGEIANVQQLRPEMVIGYVILFDMAQDSTRNEDGEPWSVYFEAALQRMAIRPGEQVLEVGVGTGINAPLYPRDCSVVGVDLSSSMLEKARERAARKEIATVRLLQMDAADLKFAENAFDIVYAPYLISVVPDPVRVAQEMRRVCRPGGRIIFLNHFLSPNGLLSRVERLISPFTIHIGFKADLDLPAFLAQADLQPVSIEKVNVPRIWSLVTCVKD